MSKTIQLTQIKVSQVIIDAVRQTVTVTFDVQDAAGQTWQRKEATFWATMPPQTPIYDDAGTQTGLQPYPDTWFQLPASYKATLVSSRDRCPGSNRGQVLSLEPPVIDWPGY